MQFFSFRQGGKEGWGLYHHEKKINFGRAWTAYHTQEGHPDQVATVSTITGALLDGLFHVARLTPIVRYIEHFELPEKLLLQGDFEVLPPIPRPSKIIAVAQNYPKHAAEMASSVPEEEPAWFLKPPSALLGHRQEIVFPRWLNSRVDPEVELGVVIARRGKYLNPDSAMACVAGYTIVNDVTARTLQGQDKERSRPWTRAKGLDTFCPVGPFLVPREAVADPHHLALELRVNGELRQSGNTSEMHFKIPELLAHISKYHTLEPGDIIATGTPAGVGPIVIGDNLEARIEELGVLRSTVAAER